MRKYILLILALLVAIGLFVYSFSYKEKQQSSNTDKISFSTTEKTTNNAIETDENSLLAQTEGGEFQLYYKDDTAIVKCGNASAEFNSWTKALTAEEPQLYYNDFDKDGEKELIIRLFDTSNDITGKVEKSYILYIFKPYTDVNNNERLQYFIAQSSTWQTIFNRAIKIEITQPKVCKKYIQFVMNDIDKPISYNGDTGITKNKYASFIKCDCDTNKNYYTIRDYTRGMGIYSVTDNGKIYLDIQVLIKYEESDLSYHIGYIRSEIKVQNGRFGLVPSTIHMEPLKEYQIDDPRDIPEKPWSYTVKLNGKSDKNDKSISWVEGTFDISEGNEKTLNAANFTSDISKVSKIEFTDTAITLTAQDGYSFNKDIIANGDFGVYIDKANKNDISYQASIDGNKLTITLQKGYKQELLTDISIKLGS